MGVLQPHKSGTSCYWGGGAALFLNQSHCYHMKYAVRRGTNNKAEFVAQWVLLSVASHLGCKRLQVMGDSKLVTDWANKKNLVQILGLGPIQKATRKLQSAFDWISFMHISRNFNKLADMLSKQELLLNEGTFVKLEFNEEVLQSDLEVHYP